MDRWHQEGGRTMTLYAEAYTALFWVSLAYLTLGAVELRNWLRTPAMQAAEVLAIVLMVWWAGSIMWILLTWTPPE